ncbi:hypothetical protein B0J14DRAFT_593484 [Halenospora varia]|nr:hypothetical protein B0J14DRAFT_593484 [Halenospora varia]
MSFARLFLFGFTARQTTGTLFLRGCRWIARKLSIQFASVSQIPQLFVYISAASHSALQRSALATRRPFLPFIKLMAYYGRGKNLEGPPTSRSTSQGRTRDISALDYGAYSQQNVELGSPSNANTTSEGQAFNELQSYAEYQSQLSDKIAEDFQSGNIPPNSMPGPMSFGSLQGQHSDRTHALSTTIRGRLSSPILIPQSDARDVTCGWTKVYAPSLHSCGIDQESFLNFLGNLSQSSLSLPYMKAVNLAAIEVTTTEELVATALHLAKGRTAGAGTFFDRANGDFLCLHGLFGLLVAFKPDTRSHIIAIESLQQTQSMASNDNFANNAFLDYLQPGSHGMFESNISGIPAISQYQDPWNSTPAPSWNDTNLYQSSLPAGIGGYLTSSTSMGGRSQASSRSTSHEPALRPDTLYLMIVNDTEDSTISQKGEQAYRGPILTL